MFSSLLSLLNQRSSSDQMTSLWTGGSFCLNIFPLPFINGISIIDTHLRGLMLTQSTDEHINCMYSTKTKRNEEKDKGCGYWTTEHTQTLEHKLSLSVHSPQWEPCIAAFTCLRVLERSKIFRNQRASAQIPSLLLFPGFQDFISRHEYNCMHHIFLSSPALSSSLFSLHSNVPLLSFPSLLSAVAPPPPIPPSPLSLLSACPRSSSFPILTLAHLSLLPLLFLAWASSILGSYTPILRIPVIPRTLFQNRAQCYSFLVVWK